VFAGWSFGVRFFSSSTFLLEGDWKVVRGKYADSNSVRYAQQVTAFPAGITTGATWDTALMYARGYALGMFCYSKRGSSLIEW
jgi:hypothetical protein